MAHLQNAFSKSRLEPNVSSCPVSGKRAKKEGAVATEGGSEKGESKEAAAVGIDDDDDDGKTKGKESLTESIEKAQVAADRSLTKAQKALIAAKASAEEALAEKEELCRLRMGVAVRARASDAWLGNRTTQDTFVEGDRLQTGSKSLAKIVEWQGLICFVTRDNGRGACTQKLTFMMCLCRTCLMY